MSNLNEILLAIKDCEDAELQLPPECDIELKNKVDGCFEMKTFWEIQEEHFKNLSRYYSDKAKVKANEVKNLKAWILMNMEKFEWDSLNGVNHKFKRVVQKKFVVNAEPNEATYELLPDLVERRVTVSYAWNLDALKKAYESDPDTYRFYGEMKESSHVRIT